MLLNPCFKIIFFKWILNIYITYIFIIPHLESKPKSLQTSSRKLCLLMIRRSVKQLFTIPIRIKESRWGISTNQRVLRLRKKDEKESHALVPSRLVGQNYYKINRRSYPLWVWGCTGCIVWNKYGKLNIYISRKHAYL